MADEQPSVLPPLVPRPPACTDCGRTVRAYDDWLICDICRAYWMDDSPGVRASWESEQYMTVPCPSCGAAPKWNCTITESDGRVFAVYPHMERVVADPVDAQSTARTTEGNEHG